MKPISFTDTSNWEFKVDEIFANDFIVTARDSVGRSIDKTGTDPDDLIEQCHQEAKAMNPRGNLKNGKKYTGMTVNERLYMSGLID